MEVKLLKRGESVRFCILCIEQSKEYVPDAEFEALASLTGYTDWAIAALCTDNPESVLSPWEARAVFGNRDFGCGAAGTLAGILNDIIPHLDTELGNPVYIIEGYSFAGLFALWAAYNTETFKGVCGVSPSVWFDNWLSYAEEHRLKAECCYLSVGASEKKSRNQRLSTVEECVRTQHALAVNDLGIKSSAFELNQGNHFTDVPLRRAKAMAWCLKTLCKTSKTHIDTKT